MGKTEPKIVEMLKKGQGKKYMTERNIYQWYSNFKKGWESAELILQDGKPETVVTEVNVNNCVSYCARG